MAGPTLMLTDWVALQATATFRRYGYAFDADDRQRRSRTAAPRTRTTA